MILVIKYLAIAVIAYLLGAIPFGLIIGKKLANVDVRTLGSGNIGATNVFRTLGWKLGLLTAVLDLSKAAGSVLLAMWIIGNAPFFVAGWDIHVQFAQVLAALAVMTGHNWSVYIGFKGGKGVATFIGGLLVINWYIALIGVAIGGIVILITRYVSLGSMLGALGIFCALVALTFIASIAPVYALYGLMAVALIIFQHRTNIARLHSGTESRIGDKKFRVKH
ncbi:MAG: glycerol-3-phosphate 1-O-acyltransferase PlsY [Dehalococcoidia bacterium]|nr:glycerol-3-phosphate 1-O-acyltransferase PlsY [Dehalococcoidia bacterium]